MGEDLLIAPVVAGEREREVYLPPGEWFDFWDHTKLSGGKRLKISVPLDRIPVFVKSETLLPLARVTQNTEDTQSFVLTVRRYGDHARPCTLFEDDGAMPPSSTVTVIFWEGNTTAGSRYELYRPLPHHYSIERWERIG